MRFDPASRGLAGTLRVPADKSISHRAALFGAMSSGPVRVRNYLHAADTDSTLAAVQALGAGVEHGGAPRELTIHGVGLRGAHAAAGAIDVGNAGTLMRLVAGWLAAQPGRSWTLDGDDSIRSRPMDRVVKPLRMMGARIDAREDRFAPLTIHGGELHGIAYASPVASAQVKSCVLIAGMATAEGATVTEPHPSRDHTERMLADAGVRIERGDGRVTVPPVERIELDAVDVPADFSSAAFFVAAALLVPGSHVVLEAVNVNWTRTGFLRIVERMGAQVRGEVEPLGGFSPGEPVSDLEIARGPLVGTAVEADEVPLAIDELPLVALLGCFAEGETVVRGAHELRVKESDRLAVMAEGLARLGVEHELLPDGIWIRGGAGFSGGIIDSHGDHRIAMAFAMASVRASGPLEIRDVANVATSFPGFVQTARSAGLQIDAA
jgi:3-phosphoshikimate 1-carboxyvinyltransferase